MSEHGSDLPGIRADPLKLAANPWFLRFWGVRGSIPTPGPETVRYGGNTSCVELRLGDEVLILDAGSGLRRLGLLLMDEMAEKPLHTTVLISHTHWDHIQGLPFFRPAYAPKNQVRILGAPGTRDRLRTALLRQMDPIQFPVALESLAGIRAIDEFAAPTMTIGSFTVRTIELNHPGGCTGFHITAAGKSVAYLPDHESYRSAAHSLRPTVARVASAASEELVQFLRGCEVLILDSQYDRTEYPSHVGWGHGCLDDSVALALRAQVEQLVLFHHDPNHNDARIDAMVREARRQVVEAGAFLRVRAARESERLVPATRSSAWLPNEKPVAASIEAVTASR